MHGLLNVLTCVSQQHKLHIRKQTQFTGSTLIRQSHDVPLNNATKRMCHCPYALMTTLQNQVFHLFSNSCSQLVDRLPGAWILQADSCQASVLLYSPEATDVLTMLFVIRDSSASATSNQTKNNLLSFSRALLPRASPCSKTTSGFPCDGAELVRN